ncbi:MAG: hypothetical protein IJC52_00435, partial [Clostridia bacterium]|nr:hypothetical protein [Clostridia bacterium]
MKKVLSVALAMLMLLTSVFSVVAVPASAAGNTVEFTLSSPSGKTGDTVYVDFTVPEGHNVVNSNMYVHWDASILAPANIYTHPSDGSATCCEANTAVLGSSTMYNLGQVGDNEFRFVFAKAGKGITAGGTLFTMAFTIISNNALTSAISLTCDPLRGNTTGAVADDYDIAYTVKGGVVTITDGKEPVVAACGGINMLDMDKLVGATNATVTKQVDGSWYIKSTGAGSVAIAGPGTYDASTLQYTHIAITSDVPFIVALFDAANNKWMNSNGDFFPQFNTAWNQPAPAGEYALSLDTEGCYTWDGSALPATVQLSSIYIEPQAAGTMVVSHLELSANSTCPKTAPTIPATPNTTST